jgi:monoamine oxidase
MNYIKLYESFKLDYDVVIIGGGISGLYTAYLLSKENINFLLIERDSELGGRIKMSDIDNVKISTGAAYLRYDTDDSLKKLIEKLKIKVKPYDLIMDKKFKESNTDQIVKKLESNLTKYDRSKLNFKEYAQDVLGKEDYQNLVNMMGYSDFEKADFKDTVLNYGLDSNFTGNKMVDMDWTELTEKLVKNINIKNIVLRKEVKEIKQKDDFFTVDFGKKVTCKKVVIATQISSVRNLLNNKIYNQIQSQEFIKIFAKTQGLDSVKTYTIVDNPLRKIIPFKDNVYCIAYSDNEDAKFLHNKSESVILKLLQEHYKDVKISNVKKFFWPEGTHYYKPLSDDYKSREEFIKKAQRPDKNIFVVGECVAKNQGWVNGALMSVESIITELVKN